ncbi:hypothetical protein HK097_007564 [Rhizophlyctis rosea]|uniref:histidine kinase n=1 Tax=Rhizophlyctis rosea TaxID=64517 RepID=A0AAD5SBE1_9FUNG|nr:hypothetical protein HK097_007564 [Rhizophlyctis rosea]
MGVITSFVAPISKSRDAAIIIAHKHRLDRVEAALRSRNIDLDRKRLCGQVTLLDAEAVLDSLLSGTDRVVQARFDELILGAVLNTAAVCAGNIFAYGELVDILSARGEFEAAIELEEMWERLLKRQRVSLLCGYDMKNFREESDYDAFVKVCRTHTVVAPCLSDELHDVVVEKDVAIALLQQKALALETEVAKRKAAEMALHDHLELLSSRAQRALEIERDHYSTLLSMLPTGVYGCAFGEDEEFYVNRRFCELVGRSEEEIRIGGWLDAVSPEDRRRLASMWPFCDDEPGCVRSLVPHQYEYTLIQADGGATWVAGETAPLMTEQGDVRGYVHTIVDITDLKRAESERLEARQAAEEHQRHRAEEAERNKQFQDQWIDSLCHELRNPLNGIYGNMDLLDQGLKLRRRIVNKIKDGILLTDHDYAEGRNQLNADEESLRAIGKCITHQKIITDDLDQGKINLQAVDFDPKAVITDVTHMFQAQAARNNLDLRTNLPMSDLKTCGDPHRLSQVLINLVANALKFTPNGSITLTLDIVDRHPKKTEFCVTVADTGVGLTKEDKEGLFHRFAQPTSTTIECGGSGLGLFISKGLVELMGGKIWVDSAKGEGSQFHFTFLGDNVNVGGGQEAGGGGEVVVGEVGVPQPQPLAKRPLPQRNASFASTASSSGSTSYDGDIPMREGKIRHILVVEDNDINQRIMFRTLTSAGYTVSIAVNGVDALSHIASPQSTKPDLIFMDIQMPVMDGLECTKELRRSGIDVPVVGLSGNARGEHVENALAIGMDWYLTKPAGRKEVLEVVRRFEVEVEEGGDGGC